MPTKKGAVGIEIEVEAEGFLPQVDNTWWKSKGEPSLRNGVEYINKQPLPIDEHKLPRIEKLINALEVKANKVIKDSHRTSIHVHSNIQELEAVELWTGITAYWLVENVLFEIFGKERQGNLFCLRLKDAEGQLRDAIQDVTKNHQIPFANFHPDHHKYGGLNLATIAQFGSAELRGMRGTVDPVEIHEWSNAAYDIFSIAPVMFKSPEELLDVFYHKGYKHVLTCLFAQPFLSRLLAVKDAGDMMKESAITLANFCYVQDWNMYRKKIEKNNAYKAVEKPVNFDEMLRDGPMNREQQDLWAQIMQKKARVAPPPRPRVNPIRFEDNF